MVLSSVSVVSEDAQKKATTYEDARVLHEQLVAHIHELSQNIDRRCGVWVEHSYARSGPGGGSDARSLKILLGTSIPSPVGADDFIDVDTDPAPVPVDPLEPETYPMQDDDLNTADENENDDWESRMLIAAPSSEHARVSAKCAELMRRARLQRLAGVERATVSRITARRLRRLLATYAVVPHPTTTGGRSSGTSGSHVQPVVTWTGAALGAYLPASLREQWDGVLGVLRLRCPKLAERLCATNVRVTTQPVASRPYLIGPNVNEDSSIWLVWVRGDEGCTADVLEKCLRPLLHTRTVRPKPPAEMRAAPPDQWCAALAASARTQFNTILAQARERMAHVILCGLGSGAALVATLATSAAVGGTVRGAALVSPPLLTARANPEQQLHPVHNIQVPVLVVCGTRSAQCPRAMAQDLVAQGGGFRRLVLVGGADDLMRLPARVARDHPRRKTALIHSIAEEISRWARDVCESDSDTTDAETPSECIVIDDEPDTPSTLSADLEEYAHLPQLGPLPATPPPVTTAAVASATQTTPRLGTSSRSIEISDGRVVARVSGGTPLLLAPRRPPSVAPSTPPTVAPTLAAADIMQMPIVFADTVSAATTSARQVTTITTKSPVTSKAKSPITVTSGRTRIVTTTTKSADGGPGSGSVKVTRVIVAKRRDDGPLLLRRVLPPRGNK